MAPVDGRHTNNEMIFSLLQELKAEIADDHKHVLAELKQQNHRIRKLEVWRAYLLGMGSVIGVTASWAAYVIWRV